MRSTFRLVALAALAISGTILTNPGAIASARPAQHGTGGKIAKAEQALLGLINHDRSTKHLARLDRRHKQDACSLAHSKSMAAHGVLSHNVSPAFPSDVCVTHTRAAENIMYMWGGRIQADARIEKQFWAEGPCPKKCAKGSALWKKHAQYYVLVSKHYCSVGLGIAFKNGVTWLTEDFVDSC